MNVTVHVASSLKGAFEGQQHLELGVPASADVGDVVQTLLVLYPRLANWLVNELEPHKAHVRAVWGHGRGGHALYLFAEGTVTP